MAPPNRLFNGATAGIDNSFECHSESCNDLVDLVRVLLTSLLLIAKKFVLPAGEDISLFGTHLLPDLVL